MKRILLAFFLFLTISGYSDEWKRVYLASYPRSGNHWVRYMVEDSTGIATSSVYCDPDPPHLKEPFPWGGFCCDHGYLGKCRYPTIDEIILLKTHGYKCYCQYDRKPSLGAIRLIRNPIDAIWSFYVYANGGKAPNDKIDRTFLKNQIQYWKDFNQYWDEQPNVFTVRYEDLLQEPHGWLTLILMIVDPNVSDEKICQTVASFPPEGEYLKHIRHYTKSDLNLIYKELGKDMKRWGYF